MFLIISEIYLFLFRTHVTVYTHDVNLNITYTHNWGVVTKTFKVTVTRKVQ